jgi:bifunctional DNA-binding transcriptional regulator/antitoxin component of YhaV-PrlF toxin-antitoxin module
MSKDFQLVKVVSGNSGSKRITIPKDVVRKLGLENTDYVAMIVESDKRATIMPAEVSIRK